MKVGAEVEMTEAKLLKKRKKPKQGSFGFLGWQAGSLPH